MKTAVELLSISALGYECGKKNRKISALMKEKVAIRVYWQAPEERDSFLTTGKAEIPKEADKLNVVRRSGAKKIWFCRKSG